MYSAKPLIWTEQLVSDLFIVHKIQIDRLEQSAVGSGKNKSDTDRSPRI